MPRVAVAGRGGRAVKEVVKVVVKVVVGVVVAGSRAVAGSRVVAGSRAVSLLGMALPLPVPPLAVHLLVVLLRWDAAISQTSTAPVGRSAVSLTSVLARRRVAAAVATVFWVVGWERTRSVEQG